MGDDIFSEVQGIEAQAERLIAEARANAKTVQADAEARIQRLRQEADRAFNQQQAERGRQHEARLADEKRRATERFEALAARLETVRSKQVLPLADWLIERLGEADREH